MLRRHHPAARRHGLAMAAAAAVLLAGCSSVADQVAERAVEEAAEAAGGGNGEIDIDTDSGSISVQTSEGTLDIGGGSLPDAFPSDVPLPADHEVMSSMAFGQGDEQNFNVTLRTPGEVAAVADDLQARFEDAGFGIDGTGEMSNGGETVRNFQFSDDRLSGNVVVTRGDQEGTTAVNYTVGTATGG